MRKKELKKQLQNSITESIKTLNALVNTTKENNTLKLENKTLKHDLHTMHKMLDDEMWTRENTARELYECQTNYCELYNSNQQKKEQLINLLNKGKTQLRNNSLMECMVALDKLINIIELL